MGHFKFALSHRERRFDFDCCRHIHTSEHLRKSHVHMHLRHRWQGFYVDNAIQKIMKNVRSLLHCSSFHFSDQLGLNESLFAELFGVWAGSQEHGSATRSLPHRL